MTTKNSEKSVDFMLRPEANAIPPNKLLHEQEKAYKKMASLLGAAANTPKELRTNRIIFIDGVAGVGKTTVYLTFKEYHEDTKNYVWLEPLELAILDRPSNALADLLTHLEQKCTKDHNFSSLSSKREDTLKELRDLQNHIPMLWDGNPRERALNMSPQAFASEVVRASEGRAQLRVRINELIGEISKEFFKNKLIILPIDDLHENSSMAMELLRLMRLINSHRFAILAIGNFDALRMIEEFRVRRQMTSLMHDVDAGDESLRNQVSSQAKILGTFSVNKLFCSSQVIPVDIPDTDPDNGEGATWQKIYNFHPLVDPSIAEPSKPTKGIVALFESALKEAFTRPHSEGIEAINSILNFPKDEKPSNPKGEKPNILVMRRRIFKLPVRSLVSLYRTLENRVDYPTMLCYEMYENIVNSDYGDNKIPGDIFELDSNNFNKIRVNENRYWDRESKSSELISFNGKGFPSRLSPTVSAWLHLLLCLSKGEQLGPRTICSKPDGGSGGLPRKFLGSPRWKTGV